MEIEASPAAEDIQFLDDRLYEFNMEATGIRNGELLAILVRDAAGAIEAGLSGWTWGDCCRIDKLVGARGAARPRPRAAPARRRRAGGRAARLPPGRARQPQLSGPGFYQRLGYELWAELEGYPSPHRQCYLRKTLVAY